MVAEPVETCVGLGQEGSALGNRAVSNMLDRADSHPFVGRQIPLQAAAIILSRSPIGRCATFGSAAQFALAFAFEIICYFVLQVNQRRMVLYFVHGLHVSNARRN